MSSACIPCNLCVPESNLLTQLVIVEIFSEAIFVVIHLQIPYLILFHSNIMVAVLKLAESSYIRMICSV